MAAMATETPEEPLRPSARHRTARTASQPIGVVVFEIDGQRYGLKATHVREVLAAVVPVPLPGGPQIVRGVINVRGQVRPVVDLRARLRLRRKEMSLTDHLIVASAGAHVVVLPVDRAIERVDLERVQIEDDFGLATTPCVAGVAKLSDGLVFIHDLDRFLSSAEAQQLEEALAGSSSTDRP